MVGSRELLLRRNLKFIWTTLRKRPGSIIIIIVFITSCRVATWKELGGLSSE
jgi:hypothetical protein